MLLAVLLIRSIHGNNSAKCGNRIARQCFLIGFFYCFPTETPHGVACFIMTATGSENSNTIPRAASASRILQYQAFFLAICLHLRAKEKLLVHSQKSSALMRIFSVSKIISFPKKDRSKIHIKISCNGGIVLCGGGKCFCRKRSASFSCVLPFSSISFCTVGKSSGSTKTVTASKFFTALRIILGPPISIFSIASSSDAPRAIVSRKDKD